MAASVAILALAAQTLASSATVTGRDLIGFDRATGDYLPLYKWIFDGGLRDLVKLKYPDDLGDNFFNDT